MGPFRANHRPRRQTLNSMNKALSHFTVFAAAFFACWFLLAKVDFMSLFQVEKINDSTEKKLGKQMLEFFTANENVLTDSPFTAPLDSIIDKLCAANDLDRKKLKIHLIEKDEVNAFAMPDDHIVVFTGLIEFCDNGEELAGVLGHEIGHLQKRHVMKKMTKEVGLSVLISIASGGSSGGQMLGDLIRQLSSSAYDRSLESEADRVSVDYLVNADVNPEPFANLLYRFSTLDNRDLPDFLSWTNTHPEPEARGISLLDYIKTKDAEKGKIMPDEAWKSWKARFAF